MEITIYSLCWNEEIILPYYFKHYKKQFPSAKFIIYDNMSNDKSRQIIKDNGGEIVNFVTNNQSREDLQMNLRNHCWKSANTDWVLICDIDEFLDVNETYLKLTKNTILKSEGYEMVGDTFQLETLKLGTRNNYLDKCLLFNKKFIIEINYLNGCHDCFPVGTILYNKNRIILRHFKYFKLDYVVNRFEILAKRLSKENLDNSWSLHYLQSKSEIKSSYDFLDINKRKIPLSFYHHIIETFFYKNRNVSIFNSIVKRILVLPNGVRRI